MNRRQSSAPPEAMDELLRSALATQAQPDAATLHQLRRQMRTAQSGIHGRAGSAGSGQPRRPRALMFLVALAGTAMTAALVFALTVLFPNPPWKQLIQALGGALCACTWLLTILTAKYVPAQQERMSL